MPEKTPEPDEFGRYRVLDKDTGTKRSILASELPHGNYTVLSEAASDPVTGVVVPPTFGIARESLSSPTNSGQSADTKKEKADG